METAKLVSVIGTALIVLLIIGAIVLYQIKKKKEYLELTDDEPANDEIVYVKHNGFILPLREEERVAWNAMSHQEKSKQVKKTRIALRKGLVIAVRNGNESKYTFVSRDHAYACSLPRMDVKGVTYETAWPWK